VIKKTWGLTVKGWFLDEEKRGPIKNPGFRVRKGDKSQVKVGGSIICARRLRELWKNQGRVWRNREWGEEDAT